MFGGGVGVEEVIYQVNHHVRLGGRRLRRDSGQEICHGVYITNIYGLAANKLLVAMKRITYRKCFHRPPYLRKIITESAQHNFMRAIWRHQRRVARQLASRQSSLARPCPVGQPVSPLRISSSSFSTSSRQYEAVEAVGTVDSIEDSTAIANTSKHDDLAALRAQARRLPMTCPGCGAPSQTVAPEDAGYYNLSRSGVRNHVRDEIKDEDKIMEQVLASAGKSTLSTLGLADGVKSTSKSYLLS